MQVSELRKKLAGLPGDAEVMVSGENTPGYLWISLENGQSIELMPEVEVSDRDAARELVDRIARRDAELLERLAGE